MNTHHHGAAEPTARRVHTVGQHTAIIEGDTAYVEFVGDETVDEAKQVGDLLASYLAQHPHFYVLCDVRRIGNVSGEVRKTWIVWFKANNPEAVIVIGAGIAIRTLVKLIVAATRVLTGKEPRFILVGSVEEGRAWVSGYKQRNGF